MELAIETAVTLRGGVAMPQLGLGLYRTGSEARRVVGWALEAGYRQFDTASMYGNEAGLGAALRDSGIDRADVFVTTKVWNDDHGYDRTLAAFEASLRRLRTDYVDLYLIHWPVPGARLDTWRALERLLDSGACRAVGVSNYLVEHLEELAAHSTTLPAVDQIELHPYNYGRRQDTIAWCREHGVAVEAYSPLTRGRRFDDPPLAAIARRHERTPAQVLIRWGLQHGFVEIPKSSRRDRIRENADVFGFELGADEMATLDARDEDLAVSWDPTGAP